jgi:uncharacterized protein (DUF1697 family)
MRVIAFLRAINVGGRTVKMDDLRRMFQQLGFSGVETFIASGNVIFETGPGDLPALETMIENHLRETCGFEVATFIRTVEEVAQVALYQPFPPAELQAATALNVAFLCEPRDETAQLKLAELRTDIDDFHAHQREIYWLCRKKQSESTFSNAVLEKTLRCQATLRNISTIKKLAEK